MAGATIIGVPKETKTGEHRVALIPADVEKLVAPGFHVGIERDAGARVGYPDEEYPSAGAVRCAGGTAGALDTAQSTAGLQYDPSEQQFVFTWNTDKA